MDFHKQDFLSAAERTKNRLDSIADSGGVVGTLMDGFSTIRGDEWEAHGYRAAWVATKGVGNSGVLVLMAEPGTPQAARLVRGRIQALRKFVDAKTLPVCLKDGIYNGDERPFPADGVLDSEWGFRTKHYIPLPSTDRKTSVRLVPRSESARVLYLHARYDRIMDRFEQFNPFDERVAKAVWAALLRAGDKRISATDDVILFAARTVHLPTSAWDRNQPQSHAAASAWATRWAVVAPDKLDDWVVAKRLNER